MQLSISDQQPIATLALSLTVFEIRRLTVKNAHFSYPLPLFNHKFEDVPFALDRSNFACEEQSHRAK